MPKLKKIIIAAVLVIVLIFLYLYFFKKAPSDQPNLDSSPEVDTSTDATGDNATADATGGIANDFFTLLLNIKSITLNDSIFSDPVFASLHDSSILLVPDGTEGRPNPFAPIGVDIAPAPIITSTPSNTQGTSSNPVINPSPNTTINSTTGTSATTPKN